MKIWLLVIKFHLEGCSSLKEKRRRMSGIRERYGRIQNVALTESSFHDSHRDSEWSFVAISVDSKKIQKIISSIENSIEECVDAKLVNVHHEEL